MPDRTQAVFLSYASQDAESARRIAEALRDAGVEVWFDQSELRGGDSWDRKIREQIRTCALFVPIISENTDLRPEGYFRLEWKLAVDRSHLLADDHPFLFPIAIGGVSDATARVPDRFREVQWTRVRFDEVPSEVAARVARLLSGDARSVRRREVHDSSDRSARRSSRREKRPAWLRYAWSVVGLVLVALYGFRPVLQWFRHEEPPAPVSRGSQSGMPTTPARALVVKARQLFEEEDPSLRENLSLAEDLLERAGKLDEFDGEVWAAHAQLSGVMMDWGIDRSDERRAAMRKQSDRALQLAPDSLESQLAKGWFLSEQQSSAAEAVAILGKLIARAPDDGRPLLQMGSAVWRLDRRDDAVGWFEKAAAFPRTATTARYSLSRLLFYQGRPAEAMKALDELIAIRPLAMGLAAKLRAQVLYEGDLDGAVETLKRIPASLLLDERGAYNAYRVWLWRREPDKALQVLRDLTLDFIDDANYRGPKAALVAAAQEMAGRSDLARGNWEFALRQVEEKIASAPNDEGLLYHRALFLVKLGRTAEAEPALRKAMQAGSYWGFNRWPGGGVPGILIKLGRTTEALDELESQLASKGERQSLEWIMSARPVFALNPDYDPLREDPRFKALLLRAKAASDEIAGKAQARGEDEKSVAVLAFANLSDDKDNEYFSDGISEELLNVLAKIPGLKVTARTSAFFFKDKQVPIADISHQLGVAYIVEGSVRKAGNRVRISAQLIKASDGFNVWSDSFDRDLKDIFAVQDEIAGLIASKLSLQMGVGSTASETINPAAFELYLKGRQAWRSRTSAGLEQAERLFNQALAIDPRFARAYVGLADVWVIQSDQEGALGAFDQRSSPILGKIDAAVRKALDLNPDLAEAHATLGLVLWMDWRFEDAIHELRRAVILNPSHISGHQWLGRVYLSTGQMDEALEQLKLAHELDPLYARVADNYAQALISAQRPQEALAALDQALTVQPDSNQALRIKAVALAEWGRYDEAITTARLYLDRGADVGINSVAYALARAGAWTEATRILADADRAKVDSSWLAASRALDETDVFNQDIAVGGIKAQGLEFFYFLPVFDAVRDKPAFVQMLQTLGMTEANARAQAWRKAHPPEAADTKP